MNNIRRLPEQQVLNLDNDSINSLDLERNSDGKICIAYSTKSHKHHVNYWDFIEDIKNKYLGFISSDRVAVDRPVFIYLNEKNLANQHDTYDAVHAVLEYLKLTRDITITNIRTDQNNYWMAYYVKN